MAAAYAIIYRKSGVAISATPMIDDLEKVKDIARDGLIRHQADEVEIREENSEGFKAWTAKANPDA
jgi:hypothetical protein